MNVEYDEKTMSHKFAMKLYFAITLCMVTFLDVWKDEENKQKKTSLIKHFFIFDMQINVFPKILRSKTQIGFISYIICKSIA